MVENIQKENEFSSIKFTNDFMFCTAMEDEKICKGFLERVLGFEVAELVYVERQKDVKTGYDTKGIRLDVYVKDAQGNVYDIEMQTVSIADLAKRCRYYHSEMDSYQIRKGVKYNELKKSFVIFVCTFDAVGCGRSIYTFRTMCQEVPEVTMNDGSVTMVLNTKGNREGLDQALITLLDFIETDAVADDFTKDISERVKKLQNDRDWRDRYMTLEMKYDEKYEQGKAEGKTEGEMIKLINQICKKMAKQKTIEEIADALEEEFCTIQRIYDVAIEFAPEYDIQAIYENLIVRLK